MPMQMQIIMVVVVVVVVVVDGVVVVVVVVVVFVVVLDGASNDGMSSPATRSEIQKLKMQFYFMVYIRNGQINSARFST